MNKLHSIETEYYNLLQLNSTENETKLEELRIELSEIYFDLILENVYSSQTYNFEERCWKIVFYSHLTKLRNSSQNSEEISAEDLSLQLKDWFYFGLGYFNSLFLCIGKTNNVNIDQFPFELLQSKEPKLANLAESLQKCLISLGNLYRYQIPTAENISNDLENDPHFKLAERYYLQSLLINPLNGRAYSQLGILNANTKYPVQLLFYYSLGLICENPCTISDKNLKFILNHNTNNDKPSLNIKSKILDLEHEIIGFYDLITCQNSWNQVIDRVKKFGPIFVEDMENRASDIDALVEETFSKPHWSETIFHLVIILLFTCWRLAQFKKSVPPNTPSSCMDILFKIQHHCFKLAIRTLNLVIEDLGSNPNIEKLYLLSIFSDFWISNKELCFRLCEDDIVKSELINFIVKLSKIYNTLYHTHLKKSDLGNEDLKELHRRPSPHDFQVWGVLPLAHGHQQLDMNHCTITKNESLTAMILIARWFQLVQCVYQSPEFQFSFPMNVQHLTIGVQTHSKVRNKVNDAMVKMAELRLQDQVEKLEKALLKKIPIQIITDTQVLLTHFNWVEDWIKRAKVRVIITRSTLDELDELKKGSGNVNFQARNIIRKFDAWGTKYNSDRIFIDATDHSNIQLLDINLKQKFEKNDYLIENFEKYENLLNELATVTHDVKSNVTSKWETYLTTDSPALLELIHIFELQGIKANKVISKLKQNH